jgi:altronate dehydratase small subunit
MYTRESLGGIKVKKAIQIDAKDNVATVTSDIGTGEQVEVLSPDGRVILETKLANDVSFGHKLALKTIKEDEEVVKYGEVIGVAAEDINIGEWVHTHNVNSVRLHTEGEKARGITS